MDLQTVRQSAKTLGQILLRRIKQRPIVSAVGALGVIVLATLLLTRTGAPTQAYSFFEAKRGDFLISIVEGGNLDAVNEVLIRNEVEGISRITFLVKEGTMVKKGDLLVELDSSQAEDGVNVQEIAVERGQFSLVAAQQQLEIQKSLVDSDIQAATLKVEFAESDLEKYIKGEMLQLQRNAEIAITNVEEELQINEERFRWSETLYAQGFETKANLDKDRLTVSQSKLKREQAQRALWMVMTFDAPKGKRRLEAVLEEAKQDLERSKLQGARKLDQCKADVDTQTRTLELSQIKLEREKKQLASCKLYAPQDGLVVYASASGGHFSSESMIEEGATVRYRQELIKLPDVSEMKLQVKIHESRITQVLPGQQAFVVLDSMPDQRFAGMVSRVAPLPDAASRYGNPNLKIYATEILITDQLPDVKPGVSARAEIIVTNLVNTLHVPIQAVTTRKGKQVVFLASAPQKPVPVTVGLYNTKFIEITSGLKDGDLVLLSPPFDTEEKDLGGAIIAEGEKPPPGATNRPAGLAGSPEERNGHPKSRSRSAGADGRTFNDSAKSGGKGDPGLRTGEADLWVQNGSRRNGESPVDASQPEKRAAAGEERGNSGMSREELVKRFDANSDGVLDENERIAMREWFKRRRGSDAPAAQPTSK